MKRAAVVALTVISTLALAAPAQADPPIREVIDVHDEVDVDFCGFPVHVVFDGTIIRTTYTDDDGVITRTREVYPGYRLFLTRTDTGETYDVAIPGPQFTTFHADGSTTFVGTGPWQFFEHPDTAEPGIYLLKGRFVIETDAGGETTSFEHHGNVTDLCAVLA